ncbi:aminophospholipid-transporting P-ATPase, putative [Plasmodium chabaudi chabaudi]|uniref:Phospholipid-transporting ATPase n=1 Tax=Plasmodium chabaudi chabaudi TaxID=31271 RepID=A0A1C6YSN2_PLACU|nr:aminophospholipid-transporting P-ATPase, putative [Plasmodium chabaudi chabaudi]
MPKHIKGDNVEANETQISINGVNKRRHTNSVITSKYTIFNFIFLNAYEQFHKISNVYFFIIGVLQLVPELTATNRIPTILFPLSIVLIANAINDAYEDWNRHKTDKIENNRICYVISDGNLSQPNTSSNVFIKFLRYIKKLFPQKTKKIDSIESYYDDENDEDIDEIADTNYFMRNYDDKLENIDGTIQKRWKDIEVGDIIICRRSDFFCADILLLSSSDPNGICFAETSSLDGETNLKVKEVNKYIFNNLTYNIDEAIEKVKKLRGYILSEKPNKNLSTMNGAIYLESDENNDLTNNKELRKSISGGTSHGEGMKNNNSIENNSNDNLDSYKNDDKYVKLPFDEKNFVLRGCKLKNIDWVIGMAIYIGKETKIQMNSLKPVLKYSKLEILTNKLTIIIWLIQVFMCIISAYYSAIIVSFSKKSKFKYLPFNLVEPKAPIVSGIISFFSWIVITANFIPICLIVTMSCVKVIQAYFISCDNNMIYKVEENIPSFGESRQKSMKLKKNVSIEIDEIHNLSEDKSVFVTNKKSDTSISDSTKIIPTSEDENNDILKKRSTRMRTFKDSKEKNYINFNAIPRTSSLIEELGQIEYIFSDKTGTLTCNVMEFRKCAINGISYGTGLTEIKRKILIKNNIPIPPEPVDLDIKNKTPNVNIIDKKLVDHLKDVNHFNHASLIYFFLHLAVNHCVMCDTSDDVNAYSSSSPDEEALVYAAKHFGITFLYRKDGKCGVKIFDKVYEIDILATIEFTSKRKMSTIVCRIPVMSNEDTKTSPTNNKTMPRPPNGNGNNDVLTNGERNGNGMGDSPANLPTGNESNISPAPLEKVKDNASNSDVNKIGKKENKNNNKDKKMGTNNDVISCENTKKHKIVVFCKGAGCVIIKKLANKTDVDDLTIEHMETYADEGLRTLCIAYKELSPKEFAIWYNLYKEASLSLNGREENIEKIAGGIENDLILQGVTGIEDKLQEGVGSTIEDLRLAGIHVWMLTGDKIETAINIGIATNLIDNGSEQFIYTEELALSEDLLMKKLDEDIIYIEKSLNLLHFNFDTNKVEESFFQKVISRKYKSTDSLALDHDTYKEDMTLNNNVLIVDGSVLDILLSKPFERKFFYLADKCSSVICGRVSPYQKGFIVSSANRLLRKNTLAIGDGANDCNMIKMANIGIGIRGQEGVQAFNSSDYGISQFRFLRNLILVHGRLSYRRISKLVVYMFYKNIVFIFPLFIYGAISLYSGQKIYFEILLHSYNVLFTSLPIIILAILDKDVSINTALKNPCLYKLGIHNFYFNINKFISWVLNSLFHGLLVFSIPLYFLAYYNIPSSTGEPFDLWSIGCVTYLLSVVIVNIKILLETYYLNTSPIIGVSFSIISFIVTAIAFSFTGIGNKSFLGVATLLATSLRFWLVFVLGLFTALTRDYVYKVYKKNFCPEAYHLLQDEEDKIENPKNIQHNSRSSNNIEEMKPSKSELMGYAFSEADPVCVNFIRKQDKLI